MTQTQTTGTPDMPAIDAEVIDAYADAGMLPADEHPMPWVRDRWEAALDIAGYTVTARQTCDGDVKVQVSTGSGVIYEEMRFSTRPLGLAMMVAAIEAVGR